jgi:hypothetical protein
MGGVNADTVYKLYYFQYCPFLIGISTLFTYLCTGIILNNIIFVSLQFQDRRGLANLTKYRSYTVDVTRFRYVSVIDSYFKDQVCHVKL